MSTPFYLRIALDKPLNQTFDYEPLANSRMHDYQIGMRVNVPFGQRSEVGLILDIHNQPDIAPHKIKPIKERIDDSPVLSSELMKLGLWLHEYYHQPVGECLFTLLPVLLRKGQTAKATQEKHYCLEHLDWQKVERAPRQKAFLEWLQKQNHKVSHKQALDAGFTPSIIGQLIDKQLVSELWQDNFNALCGDSVEQALALNKEQEQALKGISEKNGFNPVLLEGVTGSGKTEVYLQAISSAVTQRKQVLVLIPEIGLTPQTVQRFQQRFNADILLLHSGLNDQQRLNAWLQASRHKNEKAQIIIGTRSAVFTEMPNLDFIIVDEEHDASYKQQEGIRYHGRDIAVIRAAKRNIPIILGSATPSLDSLHNALVKKYQHIRLTQRAGDASPANLEIYDIRKQSVEHGIADELLQHIEETLEQGDQALVFINRRGFAPTLYCPDCGWISECKRCDARMTLHQKPAHLHCHHCDHKQTLPHQCPNCLSTRIQAMGAGTERLETHLEYRFRRHKVIRIDRDSTQGKDAMEQLLQPVHNGEPCILVGTQMLAKGHHFPKVNLVIMLNVDSGFFSADFRAMEKTAQLILQVAGRAGRESHGGRAIIQTEFADHPLLHLLSEENYHALALALLEERKLHSLPPYAHQALVRADSPNPKEAEQYLHRLLQNIKPLTENGISFIGPLPSPMELRAGRFRSQLWIRSHQRSRLQNFLKNIEPLLYQQKGFNKVRWSLDVDPSDHI
ncbi:primosomal protein N' [Bermanella marisrubri]|uniref:Replication restart protein PriA n=1 Tax=Bermanella marisrubri TaxID=207949 RepID=Q1N0U9_9GAMM|nr:primosomal protein N' [Bermanella marisrubri]EAT11925.1 primosome assembly protein PriA [Oceanobacter sp. RED65] [Bermanella marisrubri]QIZ82999.1 primosomal protein N' [Bermanella marisrubri]